MKIKDSRILVTGASGGLGDAIARRLAADGAKLIVSGRRAEQLEALASEIGAEVAVADLSDAAAVRALGERYADVDILVANAGLSAAGPLQSLSPDEIDRLLDVNVRAPIQLARILIEPMLARDSGHLVFMSSLQGKISTQGAALYSATKFALRGLAGGMRADLHATGVGVSAIFPGFISDAGMFADAGVDLPPGVGTKTPAQVAAAVSRAIARNKGEVDVAPASLRVGTKVGALVPDLAAAVTRRTGGDRIAEQMQASQAARR